MKKGLFLMLFFSFFIFCGCNDTPTANTNNAACQNITCGEHGSCVPLNGKPACVCESGYSNTDVAGVPSCISQNQTTKCGEEVCDSWQECVSDKCETKAGYCTIDDDCTDQICDLATHTCKDKQVNPCENIDCSGFGNCIPSGSNAICICNAGYVAVGTTCVKDNIDLCKDVTCSNDWEECVAGTCQAKEGNCSTNGDCLGNKYCDDTDHTCKQPLNPCDGVNCTDGNNEDLSHGQCVANNGVALCVCNNGYSVSDDGLNCLLNDPCQFVTCSNDWEECVAGNCQAKEGNCSTNGDCIGEKYCDDTDHTCKENQASTVCENVTCTDGVTDESHGICFDANNVATCSCNQGYYRPSDAPKTCLAMENICEGITCSGHGTCAVVNEQPVCACDEGYKVDGLNCNVDLCYGETCSGHGTCYVEQNVVKCNCDDDFVNDGNRCFGSCFNDNECDDGLACNGVEKCVDYPDDGTSDHFCKSGTPIDCHQDDAQYACLAAAYCDEAENACVYELPDADDDQFFDANCPDPNGLVGTDCNDNDANINFSTQETCNFLDDNCNGTVDEGLTYSNSTDKRLTYENTNSGCTSADTYGTTTCGAANYSSLWSNDEFLNVWIDQRDGNDQIYFGRYNLAGSLIGHEIQVTVTANTTRKTLSQFAIAADSTNQKFMLIWVEDGRYLKYVFINRFGAKLNSPTQIFDAGGDRIPWSSTAVTWGNNKFIVGWARNWYATYGYTYRYISFISNQGDAILAAKQFNYEKVAYQSYMYTYSVALTWTGTEILYSYYRNDGSIRFFKIDKDTGEQTLSQELITGVNSSIYTFHWKLVDGKDTYFLVTKHSDNNIKVSRYNHRYEQKNITNVAVGPRASHPSMVWTGNQYIIAYSDDVNNDGHYDIYLARVDKLGNVSQAPEKASDSTDSLNYFPRLVDRDKKFSLFWLGNTSEDWEIYLDNITCD